MMTTIKTSELTGPALNWAVAKSNGQQGRMAALESGVRFWSPSSEWADGGPIIEREEICTVICTWNSPWFGKWNATCNKDGSVDEYGPTPLIAAMRCYCASKLSDEVVVPTELL